MDKNDYIESKVSNGSKSRSLTFLYFPDCNAKQQITYRFCATNAARTSFSHHSRPRQNIFLAHVGRAAFPANIL